jgi:RNA polymerase sigma factor (sigma-70 family)
MMSDEVADPLSADVRDVGLATQAERAVLAYRLGDRAPMAAFVQAMTPLLWHTVRAQGVGTTQAEDIVQNVWLTLVRDVETIRDARATLQWMLVTARRAAWRAVRRVNDARAHEDGDEDATLWLTAPEDEAPEVVVARGERDEALWRHVQTLPERCRRLIELVALVDRPDYAEVSRALGMPVGSIGPTRGRCLAKLRLSLSNDPTWSAA